MQNCKCTDTDSMQQPGLPIYKNKMLYGWLLSLEIRWEVRITIFYRVIKRTAICCRLILRIYSAPGNSFMQSSPFIYLFLIKCSRLNGLLHILQFLRLNSDKV